MFLNIKKKESTDEIGNPDVYFGGQNFNRRSSYKNPVCFPKLIPIARGVEINRRKDGVVVTRDGNKTPVTEKTITSHATLKKNVRDKFLPTRKKVLLAPPKYKRRDPSDEEVAEGKAVNTLNQLAAAIASATPSQKIPIIINVIRQNMSNPLPVVQQIEQIIRNDPEIVAVEALPVNAPAEKTLVSWIKRAPRAIADLLKKGKVNILDPLSRAMVKASGKIKIENGNVVLGGFKIPLSRLADMGLDGIASLTGLDMPQGSKDLGKLLLEQINVSSVEEKKQEELELLEEAKHDGDDDKGFIEPVVPAPTRPAPKRPEVKEEEDDGIGLFPPAVTRRLKEQAEKDQKEDDLAMADLKGELKVHLEKLRIAVLKTLKEPAPGEKPMDSRVNRAKRDLNSIVDKADEDDRIDDDVVEEYRRQIGKADTFSQLELIGRILEQTFQEISPDISALTRDELKERRRKPSEAQRIKDKEEIKERKRMDAMRREMGLPEIDERGRKVESGRSHGSVRVLPG